MWKNLSGKVRALIIAGIAVIVILAAVLIASLVLRVDVAEAQETALAAAGGGEIVSQEIDQEGLWSEYSFDIVNGDTWYEVEVSAFGSVTAWRAVRVDMATTGRGIDRLPPKNAGTCRRFSIWVSMPPVLRRYSTSCGMQIFSTRISPSPTSASIMVISWWKRRGPQEPGLSQRRPSFSSAAYLWEWPYTTTSTPGSSAGTSLLLWTK